MNCPVPNLYRYHFGNNTLTYLLTYLQYNIVQYSTVQYSTVQYSTVQYSTVQYSTVQYSTVQYSTVQYSTVQYSTVQYSTVQYSTVQYSNRRGGWCQGVAHSIFHSMCGVSVTGAASLVAEFGTNILFKKCQNHFLTNFFGHFKNQWLDPKVCVDPSWLLVIKNGLKKQSSLINNWVIDVWSWCKKHCRGVGEWNGMEEHQLRFGVLMSLIWPDAQMYCSETTISSISAHLQRWAVH